MNAVIIYGAHQVHHKRGGGSGHVGSMEVLNRAWKQAQADWTAPLHKRVLSASSQNLCFPFLDATQLHPSGYSTKIGIYSMLGEMHAQVVHSALNLAKFLQCWLER